MLLKDVANFGANDADADQLLIDCFQNHEAYVAAKQHEKFLIIGRKGSGKTAIYRKMQADASWNSLFKGHSFSNYPWFHHDKQIKLGVPDTECFRYSWEYIILISIARLIINNEIWSASDEALEAMAALETFIVDTYGERDPPLNKIFSPETRLKFSPTLSAGWGPLKASLKTETITIDHLPTVIYEVNEALSAAVIKAANPECDYHICFDELDRHLDFQDDKYVLRLTGLLIAARDLNKRFRQNEKKISAIVFLRDDIMNSLRFEDKNKISEDYAVTIEWDKNSTDRTLKELMELRFSSLLGIPQSGSWNEVFDENYLMPGRQTKYQHILDRTFKRPRDIIKFTNEILRQYRLSPDESKFQNRHIVSARPEQAKYMRKELLDEMQQHFPEQDMAFDLLRTIGKQGFTLEAAKATHSELTSARPMFPSCYQILRKLYEFSAIGYLKVGGSGGGSEWVWRYEDSDADYDDRATVFRVHSSLKENLRLVRGRAVAIGESSEATEVELEEVATT